MSFRKPRFGDLIQFATESAVVVCENPLTLELCRPQSAYNFTSD